MSTPSTRPAVRPATRPVTLRLRIRRALRRVAIVLLGVAAIFAVPAAAYADDSTVTIDGIDVVVTAHYSCATDTVEVLPTSMTPLDGNWPVLMFGSVFDSESQTWLTSPQWYQVDGITALTFAVNEQPGPYAYITYAVQNQQGTWDQVSTWVAIQNDLDNSPVFCQ